MQLTLGEVIATLNSIHPDIPVKNGWACGSAHSYRGDSSCLAFELIGETTVGELLDEARRACGNIYDGWKGGEYKMNKDTPCYVATEGRSGDELSAFYLKAIINETSNWI